MPHSCSVFVKGLGATLTFDFFLFRTKQIGHPDLQKQTKEEIAASCTLFVAANSSIVMLS